MNTKAKTPAKEAPVTNADDTQQAGSATVAAPASGAATALGNPPTDTKEPVRVEFGADFVANGDAAPKLIERGFPLAVTVSNQMPRRVTFPELQGLMLAHVAGLPDLVTQPATFRNADQLHRFVTDVQALCELNGFAAGVVVQTA